jgi:excisionase family DNA binding protein
MRRIQDYVTVTRAAEMLGVSASTLRNWDRSGKLKAARNPMNGYRLYRREDIARLLARIQKQVAGRG